MVWSIVKKNDKIDFSCENIAIIMCGCFAVIKVHYTNKDNNVAKTYQRTGAKCYYEMK
jgi:hypothetical protein